MSRVHGPTGVVVPSGSVTWSGTLTLKRALGGAGGLLRARQEQIVVDQWLIVSLRVIHVLSGAAWVGGAFLIMGFIVPRARQLGPEQGGTYLKRFLDHPRFSTYITAVELLAVITGFILFWNTSGGLQDVWLTSPTGLAFTVGGIAAVIALGISIPISVTLSKLYYLTNDTGRSQMVVLPDNQRSRNTTNGSLSSDPCTPLSLPWRSREWHQLNT